MRVLVIPDVHLKPVMFKQARMLMEEGAADQVVCLMDIADDFGQQYNLSLYMTTYDEAIRFAIDFPDSLWCYGNHDVCYIWDMRESGYSALARDTVCSKLHALGNALRSPDQLTFIHRIDDVLFSHAGLSDDYVKQYLPSKDYEDIDKVIERVNGFGRGYLWQEHSPIWFRPQMTDRPLYKADTLVQVVGHTPMKDITRDKNLISCDVFSTDRHRNPYGSREYLVIDTITGETKKIKAPALKPVEWKD